ncbi:hypothetical protein K1T71_003572 [Dendrolimus kikuchii]|uniref:Uncharacterized protein n=1 Tax=Dendrolimus kikuchii TaxID=765133 RepID=A0ACC1DC91_9NEOP|nr:hypothetical protein K1T71_003572 [Dendrolimus kikuchii]
MEVLGHHTMALFRKKTTNYRSTIFVEERLTICLRKSKSMMVVVRSCLRYKAAYRAPCITIFPTHTVTQIKTLSPGVKSYDCRRINHFSVWSGRLPDFEVEKIKKAIDEFSMTLPGTGISDAHTVLVEALITFILLLVVQGMCNQSISTPRHWSQHHPLSCSLHSFIRLEGPP